MYRLPTFTVCEKGTSPILRSAGSSAALSSESTSEVAASLSFTSLVPRIEPVVSSTRATSILPIDRTISAVTRIGISVTPSNRAMVVSTDPEADAKARAAAQDALAEADEELDAARTTHEEALAEVGELEARAMQLQAEVDELKRRLAELDSDAEEVDDIRSKPSAGDEPDGEAPDDEASRRRGGFFGRRK